MSYDVGGQNANCGVGDVPKDLEITTLPRQLLASIPLGW